MSKGKGIGIDPVPFPLPVGGNRKEVKPMSKQLEQLKAAQEKATQKKHEAEQQEKLIKKKISALMDKERTHRLCTRGGYLEKLLLEPELLTDDEVFELLGYAFNTPYVKDRLKAILEAKHHDPGASKPSILGGETRTGVT